MDHEPPGESVRVYKELLLDRDLQAKRQEFCRTAVSSLASVASWLGLDSFLGGGDLAIAASSGVRNANDERHHAFRAAAAVVEMSSELAAGAVDLLDRGYRFAAAALIRQLIETEYLLTAFAIDFSEAARWARSKPEDIRRSFSPKTMRAVGGFPNREYWQHCDMGGHPAPSGRLLLRNNLYASPADDDFLTASVWGDLAQHLRRIWSRVDELLRGQHARYDEVRRSDRERVRSAERMWEASDPLAQAAFASARGGP